MIKQTISARRACAILKTVINDQCIGFMWFDDVDEDTKYTISDILYAIEVLDATPDREVSLEEALENE